MIATLILSFALVDPSCLGLPPVADSERLPPAVVCQAKRDYWAAVVGRLEALRCERLHRAEHCDVLLRTVRPYREFWCVAAQVRSGWLDNECINRQFLAELRQLIGYEAYVRGEWPP